MPHSMLPSDRRRLPSAPVENPPVSVADVVVALISHNAGHPPTHKSRKLVRRPLLCVGSSWLRTRRCATMMIILRSRSLRTTQELQVDETQGPPGGSTELRGCALAPRANIYLIGSVGIGVENIFFSKKRNRDQIPQKAGTGKQGRFAQCRSLCWPLYDRLDWSSANKSYVLEAYVPRKPHFTSHLPGMRGAIWSLESPICSGSALCPIHRISMRNDQILLSSIRPLSSSHTPRNSCPAIYACLHEEQHATH